MVAPATTSDHRISLQVFEGPLDLLLFLIRKNEVDIYDIPIEQVTRQYLETLRAMSELRLDLAGEFFVMAASLMEIKSRMLLPKHQQAQATEGEEDDLGDPRWNLVHQLLQYKKFKDAAASLAELIDTRQGLLERNASIIDAPPAERHLRPSDRIEVWNAFNHVLRRLAEKLVVGDISDDHITVVDQMETILKRVATEQSFLFSTLLPERCSLRALVATFLAVLELTRLSKLRVRQDEVFSDFIVEARLPEPTPLPPATTENAQESAPKTELPE